MEGSLDELDEEGVSFLDRLYQAFDTNNDGEVRAASILVRVVAPLASIARAACPQLDANEVAINWHSWFSGSKPVHALVIIDVQNDFISGSLSLSNCPAKHNGAEVWRATGSDKRP